MEDQRPKIGVGVAIHDKQGNVVMGVRSGSHGAGRHLFPLLHTTPKKKILLAISGSLI
jgi:ribosomal protein S6E (S10)